MATPRIPEGADFRAHWAALDKPTRRRIRRAVNRVEALPDAREAAIAASMADSQRRFWRLTWIVGPLIVSLAQIPRGLTAVLVNLGVALFAFGLMALLFHRRATKAAEVNRAVVASARTRGRRRGGSKRRGPKRKR